LLVHQENPLAVDDGPIAEEPADTAAERLDIDEFGWHGSAEPTGRSGAQWPPAGGEAHRAVRSSTAAELSGNLRTMASTTNEASTWPF